MFHQNSLKLRCLPFIDYASFELICVRILRPSVLFIVIYHPGSSLANNLFFNEFADLLERNALRTSPITIASDLNVHLDNAAVMLSHVLETCSLTQHISQPTHVSGHTLNVFIRRSDQVIEAVNVDAPLLSDQFTH